MSNSTLRIFAFAGPSGSGKTEMVRALKRHAPDETTFWQQVTTRPQRGPDDTDYLFIDEEQFKSVRHILTCTTFFDGKYYGTFPTLKEDGSADTSAAVLTIVDATGLRSLVHDVQEQNRDGTGKFGHGVRVELYPILLTYEITPESVQERAGNRQRSVEHVQQELERLRQLPASLSGDPGVPFWHYVSDSSQTWPQISTFYNTVIRQEVAPPVEFFASVRERLAKCATAIMGLSMNCSPTTIFDPSEIGAVISDLESIVSEIMDDTEKVSGADFRDDLSPHRVVSQEDTMPSTDGELLERVETGTQPELPSPLSPSEVFTACDFESWILEEGFGTEAFKTEYSFKVAFGQYLSSNGGNPNGLTVSSQATHDARGGRVIEYVANINGTTSYAVEYSERLRRIVGHGAR